MGLVEICWCTVLATEIIILRRNDLGIVGRTPTCNGLYVTEGNQQCEEPKICFAKFGYMSDFPKKFWVFALEIALL